jgi:hypothetical protein
VCGEPGAIVVWHPIASWCKLDGVAKENRGVCAPLRDGKRLSGNEWLPLPLGPGDRRLPG